MLNRLLRFIVLITPFYCFSQSPSDMEILRIKFLYDETQFENAISQGQKLLSSLKNPKTDELVFIHEFMALSFFNIGQRDSSRSHFLSVLSLKNNFQLDPVQTSPKILDFFNQVNSAYQSLSRNNTSYVRYIFVQDRRPNAALKSAVFPGWGQYYKEQNTKAWLLGGSFWGSAILSGVAYIFENDYKDKYLAARKTSAINSYYDKYNTASKTRRLLTYTAGVVWLVSFADALISPYNIKSEIDENNTVSLGLSIPIH